MTQAQTRGRGRPKAFDEHELLERVRSIDDLVRVRDALEANGEGGTARGVFGWLVALWAGDSSGGVHAGSAARYRAALARLDRDPLNAPKGRKSVRAQRGAAGLRLVMAGAGAGALALAALSSPQALPALARLAAPIIPPTPDELPELAMAA